MVTGAFETITKGAPFFAVILAPLAGWVFLGIHEELVFRGYQLTNIAEGLNVPRLGAKGAVTLAVVLSSVLFGLFHVWNPNASIISTINLAVWGGLLLGLGYVLTGRLALPMGLHIAWNILEGNIFGLPISGWGTLGATLLSVEQGGPTLFLGAPSVRRPGYLPLLQALSGA